MPSITSQSAAATARKARRHEQRILNRARPTIQPPYKPTANTTQSPLGRRQARDRDSFGIDDCFDVFQVQRSHRDPDLHFGSRNRPHGNQFTILEQDASGPSTPPSFPEQDFTFSYPNPCSTIAPNQINQAASLREPVNTPQASTGKLLIRRCGWPEQSKIGPHIAPSSPPLPSTPTTLHAEAGVDLPCSIPAVTYPFSPSSPTASHSSYLDDIKIPSPLLYHKRSQELLSTSSDEDMTAELAKTFLLTCGMDIPEPDFESYRPVDENVLRGLTGSSGHGSILSASVPHMASGFRQFLSFRNTPRGTWIEESAQHIDDNATASEVFSALATKYKQTASRSRSDSDITLIRRQRSSCSMDFPADIASSTALVFLRLSILAKLSEDAHKARRLELWEQSASKDDFAEDDPVTVFERRTAFEQMLPNGRRSFQGFNSSHPTFGNMNECTLLKRGIFSVIKPTVPLKAACTALDPARLYQQEYLGWPKQPRGKPNYQVDNYPFLGAFKDSAINAKNVLQVPKWVAEAETKKQDVPKFSIPADAMGSFDEDFKVSLEDDIQDILSNVVPAEADSPIEVNASPAIEIEDEGYFTAQESGREIDAEEAVQSEDEWSEWDWEQDVQEQSESDGDNDKVEFFGMELGF